MTAAAAPLFNDVADGPPEAYGYWLTTKDDLRIRVGHWPANASHGTIFYAPDTLNILKNMAKWPAD